MAAPAVKRGIKEGMHNKKNLNLSASGDCFSAFPLWIDFSETEVDSTNIELSKTEDNFEDENPSMNESDSEELQVHQYCLNIKFNDVVE